VAGVEKSRFIRENLFGGSPELFGRRSGITIVETVGTGARERCKRPAGVRKKKVLGGGWAEKESHTLVLTE